MHISYFVELLNATGKGQIWIRRMSKLCQIDDIRQYNGIHVSVKMKLSLRENGVTILFKWCHCIKPVPQWSHTCVRNYNLVKMMSKIDSNAKIWTNVIGWSFCHSRKNLCQNEQLWHNNVKMVLLLLPNGARVSSIKWVKFVLLKFFLHE